MSRAVEWLDRDRSESEQSRAERERERERERKREIQTERERERERDYNDVHSFGESLIGDPAPINVFTNSGINSNTVML